MMDGGEPATEISPSGLDVRNVSFRLTWPETRLLLVLAAVQFTHVVDFMIIMPLGPRMKGSLNLNLEEVSNIVAAYAVAAAVAGLLAAFVMDRFDRKRLLLALYTGFTVGTGLCALAPNYHMLLLGRVVAGAFGGVGASATLVIVGDAFPDSRRGAAMGVLMSAFSVASIVGVPAGILIADVFGYWEAPFAVLAGVAVLVLAAIQLVLPPLPRPTSGAHPADALSVASRFLTILLRPGHLLAYLFMTGLVMSSFIIWPTLPIFLVKNVGIDDSSLKYVYLCGGVATLLTLTWFGRLADRLGKRLIFRVLGGFTAVPLLLITNLPHGLALPLVLGATTLLMTVSSGRMVPAMALITVSAEPRFRGSFMSMNSAVQQTAMALAAVIGGHMIGETATGVLTGYPLVGCVAAGVSLLTVFIVGLLRTAPLGGAAVVAVELPAEMPLPENPGEEGIYTPEMMGMTMPKAAPRAAARESSEIRRSL
ncbi:MAG TPA: MFS transporter [Planctomycetales bacterium]|jgi:predicted MFS family arabinose efflux permease|nr:MFS transporter [Planctomycetales bacterium]